MNVVFLDYDGVVNTPMWDDDGTICRYNHPGDGKVNNFQAVQWISEFCQNFNYSIVITSTWLLHSNYRECLINGGLRKGIKILGCLVDDRTRSRDELIEQYLKEHPEIDNFLIFDDDIINPTDRLIICDSNIGFGIKEYEKAKKYHFKFEKDGVKKLIKSAIKNSLDEIAIVSAGVIKDGVKIVLNGGDVITITTEELFDAYNDKNEDKSE